MVRTLSYIAYLIAALAILVGSSLPVLADNNLEPKWYLQPDHWPQQQFDQFYLPPNQRTRLTIYLPQSDQKQTHQWTLYDYIGKQVSQGKATIADDGQIQLVLNMPAGWYELAFDGIEHRCGVAVLPELNVADPFFGIDAVLAWEINAKQPKLRQRLINVMKTVGVRSVRDRFRWPKVDLGNGRWDFNTDDGYDALFNAYHDADLDVLVTFHDTPSVMRGDNSPYPLDMQATVNSWTNLFKHYGQWWDAVEVWNEPDIRFGAYLPPDQYAPLAKALALAVKRSRTDIKLGGGVLAHVRPNYLQGLAKNGILQQVDMMTCHDYNPPVNFQQYMLLYQQFLQENKQSAMPLWVTESSEFYEMDKRLGKLTTFQDRQIAHYAVAKAVMAKAMGVSRYFPFILTYWEAWDKSQVAGLLKPDLTPGRGVVAYAVCIRMLSGKESVGTLALPSEQGIFSQVFKDINGQMTAVIFSNETDTSSSIKLSWYQGKVLGIDGRAMQSEPDGSYLLHGGVIYLTDTQQTFTQHLKLVASSTSMTQQDIQASELLIYPQPDRSRYSQNETENWSTTPDQGGLSMTVRLFNFSESQQNVCVDGTLLGNTKPLANTSVNGVIAAGGYCDFVLAFSSESIAQIAGQTELQITATSKSGVHAIPASVQINIERGMSEVLAEYPYHLQLDIHDTANWDMSHIKTGASVQTSSVSSGQGIKFDFTFATREQMDEWATPIFSLPSSVNCSQYEGLIIRARAVGKNGTGSVLLIVREPFEYIAKSVVPDDNKWHTVFIPFSSLTLPMWRTRLDDDGKLDTANIRRFHLGTVYRKASEFTLEISDVYLAAKQEQITSPVKSQAIKF